MMVDEKEYHWQQFTAVGIYLMRRREKEKFR